MKVALYLGSFNPFHNGHLKVVRTAFDSFDMDVVVIVPTMQNPWKKDSPLSMTKRADIIHTFLANSPFMYNLAINSNIIYYSSTKTGIITIDKIEESLIQPYYSYATLHALKNKYCNDEVFILCGEDTINNIPEWMNGGEILKNYDFIICDRTKESSTEIRNRIREGKSFSEFIIDSDIVYNLIKRHYMIKVIEHGKKSNLSCL